MNEYNEMAKNLSSECLELIGKVIIKHELVLKLTKQDEAYSLLEEANLFNVNTLDELHEEYKKLDRKNNYLDELLQECEVAIKEIVDALEEETGRQITATLLTKLQDRNK